MSALSGGHLAVDFASGSVPALIPFMTDRFHLGYALAAMLLLTATASSSLVQPLFGLWSDRRGALWLIPGGHDARGGRRRRRGDLAGLPPRAAARARGRPRRRGVPSRGLEVRRVCERAQARERHVVLQQRRQRGLRARRVRDRPARRLARARRRARGDGARVRRLARARPRGAAPRAAHARAGAAPRATAATTADGRWRCSAS